MMFSIKRRYLLLVEEWLGVVNETRALAKRDARRQTPRRQAKVGKRRTPIDFPTIILVVRRVKLVANVVDVVVVTCLGTILLLLGA